jgi:hypothetical protein
MTTIRQMEYKGNNNELMEKDIVKLMKKGMTREAATSIVNYYSHTYRTYK